MKSCLLIDDSRIVRQIARRILTGLGFDCTEAEDGETGIGACRASMPDLIVLDCNMPVMNGFEVLEKIRRLDRGHSPKILFCTTESDMRHMGQARRSGADEYIMKPFEEEMFRTKLQQIGLL